MVKDLRAFMEESKKLQGSDELFSLSKRKDTGEFHLFLNKRDSEGKCVFASRKSICGHMSASDRDGSIFSCSTDEVARKKCAAIGREVCGTCVSHLYADYISR